MSPCDSPNEAQQLIEEASKIMKASTGQGNHNGAEVANRLHQAGVEDKAVLVAAALGDLPYSVQTLHNEVEIL